LSYTILFSHEAVEHLESLSARDRRIVLARVRTALQEEPMKETRNLKMLRPNPLARYELRVGRLRVFFDPDDKEKVVRVLAIGGKRGNKLQVGDQEIEL
jgi:mRNA-degrading endonuclease RelE of RelBE toxin-antitoxin system